MDPVTILGTTGAVSDIVGLITKTINFLDELRARWRKVDLTIINLRSQLTCLRAALNEISELVQSDLAHIPQHHQLVIDLEQSVSCCRLLMESMEVFISELNLRDDGILDLDQKIRTVFQTKRYKEFQEFIPHQTNALNLLLSACNCKTLSEQKALLEKSANRNIFEQVRDESSSLLVLYDDESVCSSATQSTGTSSKISKIFPFDTILMSSPVYQRAIRSLLKRYRLQRRTEIISNKLPEVQTVYRRPRVVRRVPRVASKLEVETSKSIDFMLEKDRKAIQKTIKLVILGEPDDTMDVFMILLRTIRPTDFDDMVQNRKIEIMSVVIDCIYKLLDNFEGDWQSAQQSSIDLFRQRTTAPIKITPEVSSAILRIWQSPHGCVPSDLSSLLALPEYFLGNIERIMKPDYVPTIADILHLPSSSSIQEMVFRVGRLYYNFLLVRTLQSYQEKWMHQIEDVFAVLFVVDCCSYDQVIEYLDDGNNKTTLFEKTESLFELTVNSQWLRKTPVVVLFRNAGLLPERLLTSKLSNFLPDYRGGANYSEASTYMADRFKRLVRDSGHFHSQRDVFTYFIDRDSEVPRLMQYIKSVVSDQILQENLGIFYGLA